MALIRTNNAYIRIKLDGTYYIYENKKARNLEKKVIKPSEIIKKYDDVLKQLESEEGLYYLGTSEKWKDWLEEFYEYKQCLLHKNYTKTFPLMKEYYKDVDKSIPKIISSGKISVKGNTIEEVYNYVKEHKIFGETEDDL